MQGGVLKLPGSVGAVGGRECGGGAHIAPAVLVCLDFLRALRRGEEVRWALPRPDRELSPLHPADVG